MKPKFIRKGKISRTGLYGKTEYYNFDQNETSTFAKRTEAECTEIEYPEVWRIVVAV